MQKRRTIQQKLVYDTMLSMQGLHPSALEIHKEIYQKHPGISTATVYSHLRKFVDEGIIRVFSGLGSADRFDLLVEEHYHVMCETCGALCDLIIDSPAGLNEMAAKMSGYRVFSHNIVFHGICPNCKAVDHAHAGARPESAHQSAYIRRHQKMDRKL